MQQANKNEHQAFAVKKDWLLCGNTQENEELRLKSPKLPNGL